LSNPTFAWSIPGILPHTLVLKPQLHKERNEVVAHCETCAVPYTIDAACKFMRDNNVRVLVIDGQTLRRMV